MNARAKLYLFAFIDAEASVDKTWHYMSLFGGLDGPPQSNLMKQIMFCLPLQLLVSFCPPFTGCTAFAHQVTKQAKLAKPHD